MASPPANSLRAAEADSTIGQILLTGDKDLLDVAEQSPIPILSPRVFMMPTRGRAL
jgi:hypothetical protein